MNTENTIESAKTWQKLLCQAFQNTTIETGKSGISSLLQIRRFIYLSLQVTGIENRSPFSVWQLLKIRIDSNGEPQQVREHCINAVLNMSKPSFCLLSSNSYFVYLTIILSLVTLITPITANTLNSQKTSLSVLTVTSLPWQDLEDDIISLPITSDYLTAPSTYYGNEQHKKLNKLNATSWILDQKDSSYGLQLLSVSKKSNLIKFCKKHNICEQSAFYSTQVKGKKLIRLIYGSYPNHKAAKQAKANLSARLQGNSAWARSYKNIKSEL